MPHVHTAGAPGFWPLTVMWFGMMVAMMAPTVWPWVRSFHRFGDTSSRVVTTTAFAAGYLFVWLGYSMAAALLQVALQTAGAFDPIAGMPPAAGAAVFVIAGLYQFAPLKRACLLHCRSPFSVFLAQWRNGSAGAFHMGISHGLHCVGCCWALMATALVVGVMNLWWMAALAALALMEQVAPHGHLLRQPLGVAFIAAGIWRFTAGG